MPKENVIENNKFERGSEWRKWDLHIHSNNTNLGNNYSNIKDIEFIKKIKDEKINVVGLTNYFNFTEKDYKLKSKLEKEGIIVFLNLELRLTYTNKEDDCCDIHIIFDNELEKEKIKSFLNNLEVQIKSGNKKSSKLIGEKEFKGGVIDFNHLLKELKSQSLGLESKYLIGFLSRGKGNGRTSVMYHKLAKDSHFLIHSSDKMENVQKDRSYWLDKKKPLIQSSDAHEKEKIGTKYTWIKADTTFAGLKQIIYEPKDRVKIQELKPDHDKQDSLVIDRIEYKNKEKEKIVYFNNSLNSVIGSRGSGKSNLLKNVAFRIDMKKCLDFGISEKDFVKFDNLKVFWKDGLEDIENKSIQFLPQGYLSKFFNNKDKTKLYKFLTDLFKNNENFSNLVDNYRKFEKINMLNINSIIRDILDIIEKIEEKRNKQKEIGVDREIEKEIKKIESEVKEKNKDKKITEKDIINYKEFTENKDKKEKIKVQIEKNIESFEFLKQEDLITHENIFEYEFSDDYIEKIKRNLGDINGSFKKIFIKEEIKILKSKLKEINVDIEKIKKDIKPIKENLDKHRAILKLSEELLKLRKRLGKIDDLEKEIKKLTKNYIKYNKDIIDYYFLYYEKYLNLDINLGNLNFSKFDLKIDFDKEDFETFIKDNLNYYNSGEFKSYKGSYKKSEIEGVNNYLSDFNRFRFKKEEFRKTLEGIFYGILKGLLKLKSGREKEFVINDLFKNRFEINYKKSISKDNVIFDDMSDGQKMIVLLEFIFKFDNSNYPIILDQPEDDLDVRVIAREIVAFIKEQKEKRQVIIASHNANLVVCGDSENVLVSEKKGNKNLFEYKTGSIENIKICEEIKEILEGGEDAIKKRVDKLNIKI